MHTKPSWTMFRRRETSVRDHAAPRRNAVTSAPNPATLSARPATLMKKNCPSSDLSGLPGETSAPPGPSFLRRSDLEQRRVVSLEGDRITLATPPTPFG